MATFTYPGVYIEELSSGVHTITGVATSIAAFVGWAPQGPVNQATLVESWPQYEALFGGLDSYSLLGYAVNQFFANGGAQAYIIRLVWDGSLPPSPGTSPAPCATAVAAGVGYASAQIVASLGPMVSPPATLYIGAPVLQSIAITPGSLPPIPMGVTVQFAATGNNSDTSTQNLTSSATWTSSDTSVITIAPGGLASPVGNGTAIITATDPSGMIAGSITVVVSPAFLNAITVTPGTPSLAVGQTQQLAATANYTDNSNQDVTALAVWTSSSPDITVNTSGQATASAPSTSNITLTATWGGKAGTASASVSAKAVTSISISPAGPTLQSTPAQNTTFTATASYSDGSSATLGGGSGITWATSNSAVAGVDAAGKATAAGVGSTTITVSLPASGNFNQISAANAAATLSTAVSGQLIIKNSGGTIYTTLAADNTVGAVITDINGSGTGLVASLVNGQLVITDAENRGTSAALELQADTTTHSFLIGADSSETFSNTQIPAVSASTTLNVTAATLNSIAVTPASASVAKGQTQQMKARGIYSDGTTADLTGSATWTSSSANAPVAATGLVTGKTVTAPVTITASWQGVSGTANVSVTAAVLQSVAVTPASATVLGGQTQQFKATGTYSDASTADLTNAAAWKSLPTSTATINNTGLATAVAAGGSLSLWANNPGVWGNTLRVSVSVLPPPNNTRFNLLVQRVTPTGSIQTMESYVNLSISPTDPQYVVTVVDNDSSNITFINPKTSAAVVPTAAPSPTAAPVALSGGADGAVLTPASDQNFELVLLNPPLGVYLLDRIDIFNLLCIPGETDMPTISTLQGYCVTKRAFYIVDAPKLTTYALLNASGPAGTGSGNITGANSKNSAFYFPWVQAPDPLFGNRPTLFPPCGFVAGTYATTDSNPGVWKAPAGINASLTGVSGLQYVLTDQENGDLNIQAINCLRQFKVYGDVVWGARTLQGNDQAGSEWKYIPIRRLALYLESSLYNGTQWVVFEPNDEKLWSQIRLNVGAFMQGLFLKGAFQGTSPQQAYFVKCDAENNPQPSIDLGIVNILVGFAPLYPAEFVVIQIVQKAGQSS